MLKVIIITTDDPLYVRKFFESFKFSGKGVNYSVNSIVSLKTFRESRLKNLFRMFNLYGLRDFIKLLNKYVNNLVFNKSLKKICELNNVEFIKINTTKNKNFIDWIKKKSPDVILSVSAPEIFDSELISCPKICGINIHSGKLPRYRGFMPVFWQMYENQKYITISFHEIAEKVDTGGIIFTEILKIDKDISLDKMMTEVKKISSHKATSLLNDIDSTRNKPETTKINFSKLSYFNFPKRIDVKNFKKNGYKMI